MDESGHLCIKKQTGNSKTRDWLCVWSLAGPNLKFNICQPLKYPESHYTKMQRS